MPDLPEAGGISQRSVQRVRSAHPPQGPQERAMGPHTSRSEGLERGLMVNHPAPVARTSVTPMSTATCSGPKVVTTNERGEQIIEFEEVVWEDNGFAWHCTCGDSSGGFETEDGALLAARDHEKCCSGGTEPLPGEE